MGANGSNTEESTFSYRGTLIYNKAFKLEEVPSEKELVESLPEFSSGGPEDPGRGFRQVNLPYDDLDEEKLSSFSKSVTSFEYIEENFTPEDGIDEKGEVQSFVVRDTSRATMYFIDGFVVFRGSKMASSKMSSALQDGLEVPLKEVHLGPRFLRWLKYMAAESEPLTDFLEIQRLTDITYTGGAFANQVEVTGAENAEKSPIAATIDGQIESIQADFEIQGYSVRSGLQPPFSIHILSTLGIKNRGDVSRILISLLFLDSILSYWETWNRDRPTPPDQFEQEILEGQMGIETRSEVYPEDSSTPQITGDELDVRSSGEFWDYSVEQLIERGENELVEFKHPKADDETLVKELVGLANKRGGALLLGVSDDGEVLGLENTGEREEDIQNRLDTNVNPRLACELEFERIDGAEILVFKVGQFLELPHSVNNLFYTRRGTTKRKLTPYELSYLMPEREEDTRY